MPKIVDHDQRRLELVEATWRIIARHGIEGATMREIAAEAGFSNGALKPYFPTKDDLMALAFEHVFNRTNERIAERTRELAGIAALHSFCLEVLPLSEDLVSEARIVIGFWQRALGSDARRSHHDEYMGRWTATILGHLAAARERGEVTTPCPDAAIAGQLMSMLLGAQIRAAMAIDGGVSDDLAAELDDYLALLH
ncbi:TetR/AcrR family transcriptional regulator [Micrococcales bacterium 31B]|nr:TetR/AcrR family transcriptional regulator [Micrococcales bacterium 31B]